MTAITYPSAFGPIRVMVRKVDGVTSYVQNGCYHSQAGRNGVSICGYIHLMHRLIANARARRVLIIGCAGGTLATLLRRDGRHVTVADIDPVAFTVARRHFQMPDSVRCVRRDGIAFLRQTRTRWDAVMVDAFASDNQVPAVFKQPAFFRLVAARLTPGGILAMNVMIRGGEDAAADRLAQRARQGGIDTRLFTLPGMGWQNCIMTSGDLPRGGFGRAGDPDWLVEDFTGLEHRLPRRVSRA